MPAPEVSIYPPTIPDAPPELTTPSANYRIRVVTVLICIVTFVLLYLTLLFGSGWLIFSGISQAIDARPPQRPGEMSSQGWCIAYAVVAAVVFLFLVKSLFKFQKSTSNTLIEVTEEEYPVLFYFVKRICEDTKAPVPAQIFVTHNVNAAVFYSNSVLSLFLPVEKNLLIGLGLVNSLNMSEFKAVLAHEFGHFSQSSMRLGSYVYIANHVIADLVYQRDYLDDLLEVLKKVHFGIAFFALMISGVLWVLRGILGVIFRLTNFQNRALSRQMEFHADLVAVSITGSDSIVHVLKKLEFANVCMRQAASDLEGAAQNKRFSSDFYYHQTRAAEFLRRKDQNAGLLPESSGDAEDGPTQVFSDDNAPAEARMWATHPTNHDREQNAKRTYLRSPVDDRSPWLLFSNSAGLRRKMTQVVYREFLKRNAIELMPPEDVQQFIDAEHKELEHVQLYNGFYDGRWLRMQPAELPGLLEFSKSAENSSGQIEASAKRFYTADYVPWMTAHKERRSEMGLLVRLQTPDKKKGATTFDFRGEKRSKSELESLASMVDKELDADMAWLTALDKEILVSHLYMARVVDAGNDLADHEQDLYRRYQFQLDLQTVIDVTRVANSKFSAIYGYVAAKKGNLSKQENIGTAEALLEAYATMSSALGRADRVAMPALINVQKGSKLLNYLVTEEVAEPRIDESHFDMEVLHILGRRNMQLQARCGRLYFKSMGGLLSCQESIWEQYRAVTAV